MADPKEPVEDARGLLCPLPVIRLAARMRLLRLGQSLLLLATDPAAEEDVRLWCRGHRHELVDVTREGDLLRIRVRRAQ